MHIFAGYEHRRRRQADGFQSANGEPARRRRDDGPSVRRHRSEKGLGALDRVYPFHILDLGKQERVNFGLWIDTGKSSRVIVSIARTP